jgi:CubicO group peptidase (beta-lactamase class C family)
MVEAQPMPTPLRFPARRLRAVSSLLCAAALLLGAAALEAQQRVPGESWMQYASPEEAGWSKTGIDAATAFADSVGSAAFLLVYDGAVVASWGDVARRYMCHSVRKSFLSGLYGVHVAKGHIDVNATLAELDIDDKDTLTAEEKQTTVLNMLKARSGVFHPAAYETEAMKRRRPARGSHPPGTFWYYNNWDFNTLNFIFEQQTGTKIFEEFRVRFAQPLGMQDYRVRDGYYHLEPENSIYPAYPFRMSARDLARFGLLYLYEGAWGDEQLIPAEWVEQTRTSYSQTGRSGSTDYGYMWWVFGEGWEEYGTYSALGVGSQTITVLPALDIVFVHRVDTFAGDRVGMRNILGLLDRLLEARTGDASPTPKLEPLRDPPPAAEFVTLPAAELAAYAQTYAYPSGFQTTVDLVRDTLVMDTPFGKFDLLPISREAFWMADAGEPVFFATAEDGARELISERVFNLEGYFLLRTGDVAQAIAVFKRNVEYFPDSYNVYDSLAEAYVANGEPELAIENYRRSLQLNPDNQNAVDMLRRLGTP